MPQSPIFQFDSFNMPYGEHVKETCYWDFYFLQFYDVKCTKIGH